MTYRRFDALLGPKAGAYFERELESVRQQVLEDKIPPRNAMTLIPQSGDVPAWAETYTHRMCEFLGKAQFIADYADDLPMVDVSAREASYRVKHFGAAYQFSRKEIQRAEANRDIRLDEKRPRAARLAVEQKFNRIQWYGDPSAGLFGLFNFPYIPRYLPTISLSDSTQDPLDILAEMNAIANQPSELTDTIAEPNTMLLAPEEYNYVSTTPLASGSDTTILTHFLNNNPYITAVENTRECKGAGPNGENLCVVYRRATENVEHKLVEPFTQLEPQRRNMAVVTNCVAASGGVVSDYPLEMVIAEMP